MAVTAMECVSSALRIVTTIIAVLILVAMPSADFLVLGEAEGIIDTFIEAWRPLIPRKNVSQGNLVGPGVLLFG